MVNEYLKVVAPQGLAGRRFVAATKGRMHRQKIPIFPAVTSGLVPRSHHIKPAGRLRIARTEGTNDIVMRY